MKTFALTLCFVVGLLLIWVGDLRFMLTGIFLTLDAIGAQIYFNFQALDKRLGLTLDTLADEIVGRLDALEESVRSLKKEAGLSPRSPA